jgi:hypothetical protein
MGGSTSKYPAVPMMFLLCRPRLKTLFFSRESGQRVPDPLDLRQR